MVPTVDESFAFYCSKVLRKLLLSSLVISLLPLPAEYYLGNSGEVTFAPIAPLLLLVASGLVYISWWFLVLLMWPIGKLGKQVFGRWVYFQMRELNSQFNVGGESISAFTKVP